MSNIDLALMGIKNLLRRKARTILTVLGVVIGTAAIVVMMSLGIGMDVAFQQQLEEYGNLTMIQVRNPNARGGGMMVVSSDDSSNSTAVSGSDLKFDDTLIKTIENMDDVDYAIGFKRFNGQLLAGRYQGWGDIYAVDLDKLMKMDIPLSEGQMPSKIGYNEALVGYQVSKNFYDPKSRNPYGEDLDIDMLNTKVELIPSNSFSYSGRPRGVPITPTGITTEDDYDYAWNVYMDYDNFVRLKADYDRKHKNDDDNSGKSRKRSDKKEDKYDEIQVSVSDIDKVQEVQNTLKSMGLECYSLTDALENNKKTSSLIQAVLGGIGAVSLLIAAIGISNTMVMSIYERTKEIGVMKVLGAELKDIKRLFLFEAAMIGLFGGAIGIGISYILSFVINSVLSNMGGDLGYYGSSLLSTIPAWLAFASLGFSTLIGLIAGYYPAVRATHLSALEAIRTE